MKKLLSRNKLFPILIFTGIFMYTLICTYFVFWKQKPTQYFYEFNIFSLIICILSAFMVIDFTEKKFPNKPKKTIFKLVNSILLWQINFGLSALLLIVVSLIASDPLTSFMWLSFITAFLIITINFIKYKNNTIKFDYEDNCIYFNKEKINFGDINEYSFENKGIIFEYTLYLKDKKELKYYEMHNILDFNWSLQKNLRYLKIPEKYVD